MTNDLSDATLRQLVECPVCYEPMRDARILQCGHRLCSDCCAKVEETDGNNSVICAECRSRFPKDTVIKDFALSQFVEKIGNLTTTSESEEQESQEALFGCYLCKKMVPVRELFACHNCPVNDMGPEDYMCSLCTISHHRSHDYVNVNDSKFKTIVKINDCKEVLSKIDFQFQEFGEKLGTRTSTLNLLIGSLMEFCTTFGDDASKNFNLDCIHRIDRLKEHCDDVQAQSSQFLNECSDKWKQLGLLFVDGMSSICGINGPTYSYLRQCVIEDRVVDLSQVAACMSGNNNSHRVDPGQAADSGDTNLPTLPPTTSIVQLSNNIFSMSSRTTPTRSFGAQKYRRCNNKI